MLLQENLVGWRASPRPEKQKEKKMLKEVIGYLGFGHHRCCELEKKEMHIMCVCMYI